ncbi:hypothetical protein pEaSNUABM13_00134 [Erwinia phage pEa_SNUABM_13]|nr:hypothetical protein pEaSNUABM13_00134 [Erwinia phage pEa_SNUABM_13]
MAMVNGKIVGAKAKKIKKTLSKVKPVERETEKPAKGELAKTVKKTKKSEPVKEKAKKTRKETSAPELFRIAIGPNTFLSVDLANDDAGNRVVEVRKWYNTKKDSEIKPGRGGFNMQAKSSEIKLLAAKLKAIALELDAEG